MNSFRTRSTLPDIDFIEQRSSLYFGKFRYKLNIESLGLRYVRSPMMNFDSYRQRTRRSFYNTQEINNNYATNIALVRQIQQSRHSDDMRTRREYDHVSFFSNDLAQLQSILASVPCDGNISQADVSLSAEIMYLSREPRFKFRARLRNPSTGMTDVVRERVRGFLEAYNEYIRPSPKLRKVAYQLQTAFYYRLLEGCSFDFTDQKILAVVSLTLGDVVEKIFELQQRPPVQVSANPDK